MINQRSNLSRKVKALIFILILVCSATASIFTYVVAVTPSTPTIAGGIYAGAPAYTIYVDGGTYYAKNQLGANSNYSSSFGTVITYAATAINASGGGTIFLSNGLYTPTSVINLIDYNVSLVGESNGGTIIRRAGDVLEIGYTAMSEPTEKWGCQEISNLQIDGVNSSGVGLLLFNSSRSTYSNLQIVNCNIGLELRDCLSNTIYSPIIRRNNYGVLFRMEAGDNIATNANNIFGGEIQSNIYGGVIFNNTCGNNKLSGVVIEGNGVGQVRFIETNGYCPRENIIDNCYFELGIYAESGMITFELIGAGSIYEISGNIISHNQFAGNESYTLCNIYGHSTQFVGNVISVLVAVPTTITLISYGNDITVSDTKIVGQPTFVTMNINTGALSNKWTNNQNVPEVVFDGGIDFGVVTNDWVAFHRGFTSMANGAVSINVASAGVTVYSNNYNTTHFQPQFYNSSTGVIIAGGAGYQIQWIASGSYTP